MQSGRGAEPGLEYRVVLGSQGGPEAWAGVRSRVRQSGRARGQGWSIVREEGEAVREGQRPGLKYSKGGG